MKFMMAAAFALFPSLALAAPCTAPDVTGLYAGEASTPGGTKADVTLNLFCDSGQIAGQMFTSMGDFTVSKTSSSGDAVTVVFDSGASLGTIMAEKTGASLGGSFTMADDKGTISLTRKGDALAKDAMKPRIDLTAKQWHEDLAFYAQELPKRHANAFFRISREDFESEVAALDRRIDTANSDEIYAGLIALTDSIGDGHTGIFAIGMDRKVMPIRLTKFGDEFRIAAIGGQYKQALGSKLVEIGGIPIAEAWKRALTLTPQGELDQLRRGNALVYLARGYALHGLDIAPDRNHAIYTVEDDLGKRTDVDVHALAPGEDAGLVSVADSSNAIASQNAGQPFWCKALDAGTVYCDWRAYQDLQPKAKEMFALLDSTHAKKLILDMRDNGGGDNTIGDAEIVKPLAARTDVNRKGHLYVLIGAQTFSAAMNNAAQLQDETNATLVGETIGEKPNSYQEPRQFHLPNSHIVVRASTLYYEFRKEGPNVVAPDQEIIPSWADVKAGSDPVLDWVLAQHA